MNRVQKKIGFVGCGNMAQSMIAAWLEAEAIPSQRIFATNRTQGKLQKLVDQYGIQGLQNNEDLVDTCDIIILAVKPQDLIAAIEPISNSFSSDKVVISLAAGINSQRLKKLLPSVKQLVRVIPNTPTKIREGVTGYYVAGAANGVGQVVEELFSVMGLVIQVESEDELSALMVACSSGVGFIYELMVYWQEWLEEHGFDREQAKSMTINTFTGASRLAALSQTMPLQDLQARVTSKKGVTAAGIDSMRELELERALRYSFEKAALRDQEIAREQDRT